MTEESVRKTAAQKTVRKAVGRTAAVKRAPRTKRVVASDEVAEAVRPTRPRRKAPTVAAAPVAATPARANYLLYAGIAVFALLFGMGAVIGFSSDGAIDVGRIMNERIAAASPEERARLEQAQRATANQVPDGGLIASGAPEVPAPVATSTDLTASSTDATASSTASTTPSATDAESTEPVAPDGGLVAPL